MNYFIDKIEDLNEVSVFDNSLVSEKITVLQQAFYMDFTNQFDNSESDIKLKRLITNTKDKLIASKRFINDNSTNKEIRKMFFESYLMSYNQIEAKCGKFYPDLFKLADSWSFNNIGHKYPDNGYLWGKSFDSKQTPEINTNKEIIGRNEILQILFKNDSKVLIPVKVYTPFRFKLDR